MTERLVFLSKLRPKRFVRLKPTAFVPKKFAKQRAVALFFFVVLLSSMCLPLIVAYAESAPAPAEIDITSPNQKLPALLTGEEPKSDATDEDKQELKPVTEEAKKTAVTKDPVKTYLDEQAKKSKEKPQVIENKEDTDKRTANSRTYTNTSGGKTERIFNQPVNYQKDGKWQSINGTLKDDDAYNKAETNKESIAQRLLPGKPFFKRAVKQDDGFLRLNFKTLGQDDDTISVTADNSPTLKVKPLDTNANVNPSAQTAEDGTKFVQYTDA